MIDLRPDTQAALAQFVREAELQLALLLEADGRVIAQHGFTRRVDVVSASTLASAIQSSTRELGDMLGDETLGPIHHAGDNRQLFLAPLPEPAPARLVLAVWDDRSSLGLVRVFWAQLAEKLHRPTPTLPPAPEHFERDLQASLTTLFGAA
ncbi:MAG: roadblock/LC7 domain-containing protein [Gemmatimonadaceae bacterium]